MRFPPIFISWVRECISTPKFSINVNGEIVGFFSSTRGLRQGDPISSYQFVLVMEALSMLIQKRVEESSQEGHIFEYHWRCKKTKTTHLCFADDLMIFCGGSIHSAQVIHHALLEFSNMSGLVPNNGKSCIFIAGNNQTYILDLFQFPRGTLPVRYLGVPLITSKLNASNCKPLVDSITARIRMWTSRFLSFPGRLQLIHSVLCSIQSYWNVIHSPKENY